MKKIYTLFFGLTVLLIQNIAQTVTDFEGNIYQTIAIGTQIWMKENLKSTYYSDGTSITGVFVYNDEETNAATYGRLYTWSAVMKGSTSSTTNPSGVQGICPTGWHVASYAEWNALKNYVGNDAKKLREAGNVHWISENPADNSSGFTALPGGHRFGSGEYNGIGNNGKFWSATEEDAIFAAGIMLSNMNIDILSDISKIISDKSNSESVRCVSDLTATSVEILTTPEYYIRPNPSSGLIIIENLKSNSLVTVFSIEGKILLIKDINEQMNSLDIGNLSDGIYLMKIENPKNSTIQKIIKN